MDTFTVDKLTVCVARDRAQMGRIAAAAVHDRMLALLAVKAQIRMIFAAAPSQNETLAALVAYDDIDWTRVQAFHMDEYVGLDRDAPQRFGAYLHTHIFGLKPFASVHYLAPKAGHAQAECDRYAALLNEAETDIVCLGIGENGHIAFNDPDVADFRDSATVKEVALDAVCRRQQVNDGCFASLSDVPQTAVTLTVPALFRAGALFCSVPGKTKAHAVRETLQTDRIDEHCPATVMRRHDCAFLFCDRDSTAQILP